uniref:Acrosin n=1 Tax=Vombatus ursinus TaxID=29139 RepID=A0A4X2K4P4_VOMUR
MFRFLKSLSSCSGLCGQRPFFKTSGPQIIGGTDASPGSWPWIVSLQIQYWNGKYRYHMCGGTLISPTWVLTALGPGVEEGWAKKVSLPRALYGGGGLFSFSVSHEHYNKELNKNDIALIEMDRPIECGDLVRIACLPRAKEPTVTPQSKCAIGGWRRISEESFMPHPMLQEAEVDLLDTRLCNRTRWYYGRVHQSNLCAGYWSGKVNTCQGDSGGPLMCKDAYSGTFLLVGITSWGASCGRTFRPGIYTSTWHFLDWITSKVGSATVFTELPARTTIPTVPKTTTVKPTRPRPPPWTWIWTPRSWADLPWWIRTSPPPLWTTRLKTKGALPQMWPKNDQPWPPGRPLTGSLTYTALQPWMSNPVMVKAQVLGPSQALSLTLSFPKRSKLLMDSMKSNNII